MFWPLLLAWNAAAELPLPSYKEEIVVAAWYDIDRRITRSCTWQKHDQPGVGTPLRCDTDALREAVTRADHVIAHISDDARLHYLKGLAWRYADDSDKAEAAYKAALTRDDSRAEAWLDLGELLASQRRWEEAEDAFTRVTELLPAGPGAWFGWLQRAQVAAHLGKAEAFESHLREALRHGFSFRTITGQPAWKAFYADPQMQASVERLISIYGSTEILESLR